MSVRKLGAFAGGLSEGFLKGSANNRANRALDSQIGQVDAQNNAMKDYGTFLKGWLKNMGVKGAESIDFGDRSADPAYKPTAGIPTVTTPSITGAPGAPQAATPSFTATAAQAANAPIPGMAPRQIGFPPQVDQEY